MRTIGLSNYYTKMFDNSLNDYIEEPAMTAVELEHVILIIYGFLIGILVAPIMLIVELAYKRFMNKR